VVYPSLLPIPDCEVHYETLNNYYPLILPACEHSNSKSTERKLLIVKAYQ